MKRLVYLLLGILLFACKEEPKYPKAENALDAGREFIDAFLKGDTQKAKVYMIDDKENSELLKKLHRQLRSRRKEDRDGYKASSIIIGDVENVSETETIIQYKSSYDKIGRKVKVVNRNNQWLVDLKYTFNPNM
jgi:hypothetical protein